MADTAPLLSCYYDTVEYACLGMLCAVLRRESERELEWAKEYSTKTATGHFPRETKGSRGEVRQSEHCARRLHLSSPISLSPRNNS